MEDGDREKYHVISRIQDFVFYSKKMGCIRFFSSQVYNKDWYQTSKLSNYKIQVNLVISKSKGMEEILRDIRSST